MVYLQAFEIIIREKTITYLLLITCELSGTGKTIQKKMMSAEFSTENFSRIRNSEFGIRKRSHHHIKSFETTNKI